MTTKITPPKELELHMMVAKLLREHCLPDWRHTHFPGGELLPPYVGAKLKRMGKMPGWPDFLLINPDGRLFCLELKRASASLSAAQSDFRIWCMARSVPHATAYSLDDVCMIFDEWNCLQIKFRPD